MGIKLFTWENYSHDNQIIYMGKHDNQITYMIFFVFDGSMVRWFDGSMFQWFVGLSAVWLSAVSGEPGFARAPGAPVIGKHDLS